MTVTLRCWIAKKLHIVLDKLGAGVIYLRPN